MPSLQAQARLSNARQTIQREANIVRGIVQDVRGRFGANATTPTTGSNLGGIFGSQGSLIKAPIVLVAKTADNLEQHVQNMARINRGMLR